MADEWYYARQGDEFGPVSAARLKQLAAAGQLQPTDLVWKIGMDKKVPARAIKGLFGNGSGAAADSRIPPPPSRRADKDDIVPVDPIADDEEIDADRPRKRPAKKGRIPVWVWIVLGGGLFLVCCVGAPLGGYFASIRLWASYPAVTTENMKKVKTGMTLKEVEAILGKGNVVRHDPGGKEVLVEVEWDDGLGVKWRGTFINDRLIAAPPAFDFKELDFKDFKGKEFK